MLWASRFEAAQTNTALGFELQTVAAPVVGGVNIFGGSGSVLGAVLGAFLLGIINNALTLVQDLALLAAGRARFADLAGGDRRCHYHAPLQRIMPRRSR